MTDRPRLIEVAFPLKETSIDSVHEKNIRHGHISTLHIWPARRPLAASRAALIATLLPDPGDKTERDKLLAKIGGKVVTNKKTGKEETEGGILHWGRESSPDLGWIREKIRESFGGRAPRVLDPFSGGGAIPLEAMRLGCEVTAVDINPVAWFILKCTLEYPQKLAGKKLPLPKFALEMPSFRTAWEDAQTKEAKKSGKQKPGTRHMWESTTPDADLAWHVRAWGHWVLERARKDLGRFYPIIDNKPTVAYLWARTVKCKDCGAAIPLLKTRWLCTKESKRILLAMTPLEDRSGVRFDITYPTAAQSKDKKMTAGTMSRSGAQCPCCPAMMTSEDIRLKAQASPLGAVITAVVVNGNKGKEYRRPTSDELAAIETATSEVDAVFGLIPFGIPNEPVPQGSSRESGGSAFTVHLYGLDCWRKLFTPRQLVALGTFVKFTRLAHEELQALGSFSNEWREAIIALLAVSLDRLADRSSAQCRPDPTPTQSGVINTFSRFALPICWDFIEGVPIEDSSGGYIPCLEWVAKVAEHTTSITHSLAPHISCRSATKTETEGFDVIVTDPPYYDAIPYSDLMDFFYIWLRRSLRGLSAEIDSAFEKPLGPKWSHSENDGELIDEAGRFGGDKVASKRNYESGMARAFAACRDSLTSEGRLVIVFAHKQPDAWETLVSAIIRAGFVVDGSWPIQTEMGNRTRALASAALSSSVWLVCKKRPDTARPGWDNRVLEDMQRRIYSRLRDFWDAGIRGPDVVWAATGPALEAYSKHPVVKKANEPGQSMTVSEFLRQVRRIVVDFVVGRVLTGDAGTESVTGLDDVTTYYLLHRHDFGLGEAPVGASILYAVSCGLSDRDLSERYDLLVRTGGSKAAAAEDEPDDEDAEGEEADADTGSGSGNKVKLRTWDQRRGKNLGVDVEGKPAPLVDKVHRLMHLWRTGEQIKVNEYLDTHALSKSPIFHQLLQAIVELAPEGSEERALLESISNHIGVPGRTAAKRQLVLPTPAAPQETEG